MLIIVPFDACFGYPYNLFFKEIDVYCSSLDCESAYDNWDSASDNAAYLALIDN